MRAPPSHQLPYRADIDGLRAFAVLSVILFHAHPSQLPGGFIGVDVFFVISGFLISSLLLDSARQQTFSFFDFYSRRVRRILPALIIVLCAVLTAGWLAQLPSDFSELNKLILSTVLFVPNIRLWTEAGYFSDNSLHPLLHLWSLGVEEQFYLVWPALVLAFWKRKLPWVIAILAVFSFAGCILFGAQHTNAVFYFPVTRLWELLAGAFLAWQERKHLHAQFGATTEIPAWLREVLSLLGAALLLSSVFFINSNMPFPGWWTLPPVIGTVLLIAAGSKAIVNRGLLAGPQAVFLGLISYPLYLWHWPVLVFLRIFKGGEPTDVEKNIGMLAAVLLAWLTYRFVEKPFRSLPPGLLRRNAVLALLGAGVVLALVSTGIILMKGLPERYPANLQRFLTFTYDARSNALYQDGVCFFFVAQPLDVWKKSCTEPQTAPPKPLVVLWGDSHAAELWPGLKAVQRSRGFRIGQMTGAACPPFIGFSVPELPYCRGQNDFFLSQIVASKPETVILSADWFRDDFRRLGPTIALLKQAHVPRIVVVGPGPYWIDRLPAVLFRWAQLHGGQIPSLLGQGSYSQMPDDKMKEFLQPLGVVYVSAFEAFCAQQRCMAMDGKRPEDVTAFDTQHLTNAGSVLLVRRMADAFFGTMPGDGGKR